MIAVEIPVLVTDRLRLRPLRESDVGEYAALHADPEVMRYLGEPWDEDRAWRHLAFLVGHWEIGGTGMWAMEQKVTGAFAGIVGFSEPPAWPGCELAWKLGRRFWGNGYATEGARAALEHAFSMWKKDRVISLIPPDNHASIRVAERIGERLLRRLDFLGCEMLCYGIDRESRARHERALLAS